MNYLGALETQFYSNQHDFGQHCIPQLATHASLQGDTKQCYISIKVSCALQPVWSFQIPKPRNKASFAFGALKPLNAFGEGIYVMLLARTHVMITDIPPTGNKEENWILFRHLPMDAQKH